MYQRGEWGLFGVMSHLLRNVTLVVLAAAFAVAHAGPIQGLRSATQVAVLQKGDDAPGITAPVTPPQALAAAQARVAGNAVSLELELNRAGRPVYEVRVLNAGRNLIQVKVDGTSGRTFDVRLVRRPVVLTGNAVTMEAALATALGARTGFVQEVELKVNVRNRPLTWEVKVWMPAAGEMWEIKIHAVTGRMIKVERDF